MKFFSIEISKRSFSMEISKKDFFLKLRGERAKYPHPSNWHHSVSHEGPYKSSSEATQ